jgi:hypothetical protein
MVNRVLVHVTSVHDLLLPPKSILSIAFPIPRNLPFPSRRLNLQSRFNDQAKDKEIVYEENLSVRLYGFLGWVHFG